MSFDFDLFVIGGGSGGVRAGRIAAGHGARVALAEEYRMGGTCVIRGCVPKKLLVYASGFPELVEKADAYGWEFGEGRFDWSRLIANKDAYLEMLESAYRRGLDANNVTVFDQRATVSGAHEIRLSDGTTHTASHILIATGGHPFVPDIEGREHVITSNDVFDLADLPGTIVIVGGGYIASEFAGIFNGLGANVHQVYRRDRILRGFDGDIRDHVIGEMAEAGVTFHVNTDIAAIYEADGRLNVILNSGDEIAADQVLYATGRVPNTTGLGLENTEVRLRENGAIEVDGWSQSNVPSIFAVGDVTDRLALTPVAIREGHSFADTVFGNKPRQPDHDLVPTAVFTQPEIGTVGMTEEAARETHDVVIYKTGFGAMFDNFAGSSARMFMKLVVDRPTDRVLGVHLAGHGAGEMIQMVGIAIKMGATKAQFDATVAVHPTAAEELVTMREPVA